MDNNKASFKYVARDSNSYHTFAKEILQRELTATFYPKDMTIIMIDLDINDDTIEDFIDENELNFSAGPIEFEDLYKKLQETKEKLEVANKDRGHYRKLFIDAIDREKKVKEGVEAIALLLSRIYPG